MKKRIMATAFAMLMLSAVSTYGQTLVPNTATWQWLHPTDGVDPADGDEDFHSTFHTKDFDDSAWKSGKDSPGPLGGFGYGDEGFEGVDIGQPEGPADRKTAYFRHKFKTTKEETNLVLKCQRDDGVIVYIDGKEVARDNVGEGDDAYDLFAEETTSGEAERRVHSYPLKVTLDAGEHVLAISLHNREGGSSDLRIAEISLAVGGDEASEDGEDK